MTGADDPAGNARAALDEMHVRFAAGRLWAAHQAPYLASAIFALVPVVLEPNLDDVTGQPVADPEFASFPTDAKWRVHIDPGTVLATDPEVIGWWLLHQVGHLVRRHASRSPVKRATEGGTPTAQGTFLGRDPLAHRWNQAADAEINDDLEAEGLGGPVGAISPATLGLPSNRMAEEYMSLLDVLDDALAKGGTTLGEPIDCGGAVDGLDRSYEASGGSSGGIDDLERDLLERSIAKGIQERAAIRSSVPGGWTRWAEELLRPEVNWRARVGSLIRKGLTEATGRVDFSYRRPSRRSAAFDGIIMPSMVRPVPDPVVVIDTSGSVTRPVLTRLITEIGEVIDKVSGPRRRLRAICCDIVAQPVQQVRRAADIQLTGGGGTDMRAGLKAAAELRPPADLIIVMTDGQTPWPDHRPSSATVVVCLIGDEGSAPAWATQVRIPEERRK